MQFGDPIKGRGQYFIFHTGALALFHISDLPKPNILKSSNVPFLP